MTDNTLPPDVQAYLFEAAGQIMQETGFVPKDEADMAEWLKANIAAVGERAKQLQWNLLNKLSRPGVMEAVKTIIGAQVWATVRNRENNRTANLVIGRALREEVTL